MKVPVKKTILLLLTVICLNTAFAQKKLTETEKLTTTAKVWGFLKYYHPNVADGKYNWDEELFKILPRVENCDNTVELSQLYLDWINSLGNIKKCKKCTTKNDIKNFDKNFDLSWIRNRQLFTSELSDKLKYIEINRHQGKKHYVSVKNKRVGNIEITNEIEYKNFNWKSKNLRLLSLFRYWNIIEYFFPYKYQTDTNWNEVFNKMISKFLDPKTEIEYHLAMLELIVSIDDSHGSFTTKKTNKFFGYYWAPLRFKLIDEKVIITGFYNDSLSKIDDLKIGDVITKVNNQKITTIFKQKEKYINGSNISRKKANAYYSIFNGSTNSVKIEYIRNNKTYTKSIKRYLFNVFNYKRKNESENYKILNGNIGYVNMGKIKIKEVPKVMESLKNTKAIIFDIRNYPNGTYTSIVQHIKSKKSDFYKVIYPNLNYPGKFIWRNGNKYGRKGDLIYKGKVVLLVNEKSQSHAEFTAMCLQTGDNVTTIGNQTSGADGNVSMFVMVGGYKTMITGIGIFYPDKTKTQRKGVKIDIVIKPTIKGIIENKDEVLGKAIEFINE